MDKVAVLRRVPWFADLAPSELALLQEYSDARWYPKGSIVFYEGDPGDCLLVIMTGRLRIELLDADGSETIIRELGPLEHLGELSLLDGLPRSASAVTLERSQVLRLVRDPFLALLRKHPEIALKVMTQMAADLRRATEQIRTLSLADLRGQVVRCHIHIALENGQPLAAPLEIRPQPSRAEIAKRIGCRPESVSRAMKELYEARYVTKTKGGVVVEPRARRYWPSLLAPQRPSVQDPSDRGTVRTHALTEPQKGPSKVRG
jgi:CRP/FNR family transcriptional regulator, cyclic AMP receptor protein